MSLLEPQEGAPQSQAKIIARLLLSFPHRQFTEELAAWQRSVSTLWRGTTDEFVSEVLLELGTKAAELFSLSVQKAAHLESLVPGCTADTLTLIRPFTIHEDGTVTLAESW
jgi:hypothetical protein